MINYKKGDLFQIDRFNTGIYGVYEIIRICKKHINVSNPQGKWSMPNNRINDCKLIKDMKKEYQLPKEFAKKWIEALSSEDYTQTNGTLYDVIGYCCLGVACKVVNIEDDNLKYYLTIPDNNELFKDIPEILRGNSYKIKLVDKLTSMNDNGKSFKEIADWIENNIEFV